MDINMFGHLLMTYIEVSYHGGVQQFTEDGGLLSVIPFAENTALIYLKDPSEEFLSAIDEFNYRHNSQVKFASDLNFETESKVEVLTLLADVLKDIAERFSLNQILVNPSNSLVLYITLPEVKLSEEDISEISSILVSRLTSLVRGILIVNNELYPFSQEGVNKVLPKPEPITHDQDITEDHITDLKIALGKAETVEDFLNMI